MSIIIVLLDNADDESLVLVPIDERSNDVAIITTGSSVIVRVVETILLARSTHHRSYVVSLTHLPNPNTN
jgi:hypothetical protein